jgi:hypothetical protein
MIKRKDPLFDEINTVIRERFGLSPQDDVVNVEIIMRKTNPDRYDRMRASFEAALAASPNREEVLRRSYVGETFTIQLQSVFPRSEIEWIPPKLAVHYPICTADEIRRINYPNSAEDHLLTLRADAIADNPRLKKVFLRRRERNKENWSLTAHFECKDFKCYLKTLPIEKRTICHKVPAGMAFLREPNGACMRSDGHDFIVVSESLRYYLYYMNAFLLGQNTLQGDDILAALLIAVRTMLQTEALDFDIDPRGDLPAEFDQYISALVDDQIQFVIGHEYAHLMLGHLKKKMLGAPPLGVMPHDVQERVKYYTPKQNQELAADAGALLDPNLNNQQVAERLFAATWFFLGLEIFYAIAKCVGSSSHLAKTHPPPIERIWALRREVLGARTLDSEIIYSDGDLEQVIAWFDGLKMQLLGDFVQKNSNAFKTYGSIYIPTYRGAVLHDRIDY